MWPISTRDDSSGDSNTGLIYTHDEVSSPNALHDLHEATGKRQIKLKKVYFRP